MLTRCKGGFDHLFADTLYFAYIWTRWWSVMRIFGRSIYLENDNFFSKKCPLKYLFSNPYH